MRQPRHLIMTVGTSLLANLRREPELSRVLEFRDSLAISAYLKRFIPTERICGAELNSTFQLFEQGYLHAQAGLYLCVSDTDDGRWIGQLLQTYLGQRGYESQIQVIEGLQDQDPLKFSQLGLRNLVRLCGKIIREAGGPEQVALNATGGYKAQIAVAALIGSALSIPVYYKHEQFDSVIGFPPLPVSLDDQLIERHLGYLLAAEASNLSQAPADDALKALIDEVDCDGELIYSLSPLGQICLTSYEQRFPIKTALPPAVATKKHPRMRDDHYPKGFETYVEKVWRETNYIEHCVSLPYDRQPNIRDRHFYLHPHQPEDIVAEYRDKDGFGARFLLLTSAKTARERQAVIRDLSARYGR